MATIRLPPDFKEFLQLLNVHQVEYLLIGGYAVGYHGYPRATADLDIWVAMNSENAKRIVTVLKEFGFDSPELIPALFLQENKIIRLGVPPVRIEIATSISGVTFDECYAKRLVDLLDQVHVNVIDLEHLKINKKAAGCAGLVLCPAYDIDEPDVSLENIVAFLEAADEFGKGCSAAGSRGH